MWHQIPYNGAKAPEEARSGGPGADGRPLVPLDRANTRPRGRGAREGHDPSTPVDATQKK